MVHAQILVVESRRKFPSAAISRPGPVLVKAYKSSKLNSIALMNLVLGTHASELYDHLHHRVPEQIYPRVYRQKAFRHEFDMTWHEKQGSNGEDVVLMVKALASKVGVPSQRKPCCIIM